MRIHSLEHAPFEGPGRIAAWAAGRGHLLNRTALYDGKAPPALDAFDLLVVMGGAMSIHEHRHHPWLPVEKRFLREAIRARKPILGVCLGAQLLADVLGGKVFQNPVKEIGWFPVRMLDRAAPFAAFPERLTVMHWHGDTFTIPAGARHVAESDACANQAFVHGDRIVGLQFHIELEKVGIEDLAAAALDEAGVAPFIQPREQLIAPPPESSAAAPALYALLDELARFFNPIFPVPLLDRRRSCGRPARESGAGWPCHVCPGVSGVTVGSDARIIVSPSGLRREDG